MRKSVDIHVEGTVQGVGFRPFVYGLAIDCGLAGWVSNASDGVHVHAEGDEAALGDFAARLKAEAPAASAIASVRIAEAPAEGCGGFRIAESDRLEEGRTRISPDLATCPRCLGELFDPADRRYRYPFINCTNCGPRFTVIEGLPYDRPLTSMRAFEMCPECAAEYADPANRRFHAQPDACFACGPALTFAGAGESGASPHEVVRPVPSDDLAHYPNDPSRHPDAPSCHPGRSEGSPSAIARLRALSDEAIAAAARVIDGGGIVAVKGLGGYHLACDACSEEAVAELRRRKKRPDKPFAVMVDGISMARRHCIVDEDEAALLESPAAPIVLLRRLPATGGRGCGAPAGIAPGVARGLAEIGVMLPATPVQHLLVRELNRPLVMTSGNVSDEPIATGVQEAHGRLSGIADAFLDNDRAITARYDDSVMRVSGGRATMVRRARGHAPMPLAFPLFEGAPPLLAVGPELKNTFALVEGGEAYVSQHIGDMGNADALDAWEDALGAYRRLFRIEPLVVAHDLHPEYRTTKWALARARGGALDEGAPRGGGGAPGLPGLPGPRPLRAVAVQHHHAHIASVIGEHLAAGSLDDPSGKVLGVALDGTGMGDDGSVWGGEVLVCDAAGYTRLAHFPSFSLIGGDQAVRDPLRLAFSLLRSCGLEAHPAAQRALSALGEERLSVLAQMEERGVNAVGTTSAGRLFDAVSALLGTCTAPTFEGQAAMVLEAAMGVPSEGAAGRPGPARYRFGVAEDPGGIVSLDPAGLLEALLDDVSAGVAPATVSEAFHRAVVDAVAALCIRARAATGISTVALSGGVFANRYLARRVPEALEAEGFRVLLNRGLPPNDGCISYGQAVVAAARLARRE